MLPPVILVNEQDEPVGTMEKLEAHQKGLLHRAFSVFVVEQKTARCSCSKGRRINIIPAGFGQTPVAVILCRGKNEPGCCSRRLMEEMGFDCELQEIFSFTYRAEFDNGLTEHEFDHVFFGTSIMALCYLMRREVQATRYLSLDAIRQLLLAEPETFTHWFHLAFPKICCVY